MCSSYILTNAVPLFLLFSLVRLVHSGAGEALLQMLVSSPAHHILLLSLLLQLAPKGDNVPSLLHVWAVFVKLHCSVDYSEQVLSEGTVVWSLAGDAALLKQHLKDPHCTSCACRYSTISSRTIGSHCSQNIYKHRK